MGVVQAMAIMPGISRSGSTIATALFLGVDRKVAGRYSFLLSIPAIVGALVLGLDTPELHTTIPVATILVGSIISAAVGWLALVIVIAGNWKPAGILIAALVFAFLEAFQLQVQGDLHPPGPGAGQGTG